MDALVDEWGANFVRLLLESYGTAEGRVHYRSVLDDPGYLADIVRVVAHARAKGAYVLLSVWHDPSLDTRGLPTARTRDVWKRLVDTFRNEPHVLFGIVNEPEQNFDGKDDPRVWEAFDTAVATIRAEEGSGLNHVVAVQGTGGWSRRLDYYVKRPIAAGGGKNVAYEVHVYNPKADFDKLVFGPAKTLPVIIGEFGPVSDIARMSLDDCAELMKRAEEANVPYLAFTFHFRCPPNLLEDRSGGGCGRGMSLAPSPWGRLLKERLAQPW
jgi:endoglucanase